MTDEEFENRIITIMHETLPSVGIEALTVTVSGIHRTPTSTLNFARAVAALYPADDEIERLRSQLDEAVREREDYNGKHQSACLEIERLTNQLVSAEAEDDRLRKVCHELGDKLATARGDAIQECIEICNEFSDTSPTFIASKLLDLALTDDYGGSK